MSERLAAYRKAIVAGISFGLLVLVQVANVAVPGDLEPQLVALVDAVIALVGTLGVFHVRNEPRQ